MQNAMEPRTPTPPLRPRTLGKAGASSPRVDRLTNNAMDLPEKAEEAGLEMATVGVRPVDTARFDTHSSVETSPVLRAKDWPTSALGTHPDSPSPPSPQPRLPLAYPSLLPRAGEPALAGGAMSNPFVAAAAPAPREVRSCVCVCVAE